MRQVKRAWDGRRGDVADLSGGGLRIGVTQHLHAIMFIESRIWGPHVRRPKHAGRAFV